MMEFANKTQLCFEPGISKAVAVDETGSAYETPLVFQETLGDLSRLSYLNGQFKYRVELSGVATVGAATIKLMAGAVEICKDTLPLSSGQTFNGSLPADIHTIAGSARLAVVLTVETAADENVTAQLVGVLEVSHPIVIAG